MNMVIPDVGKELLITWMLQLESGSFGDMKIALFQNNITPDDASVFGDFTPAAFTGSTPVDIARADWSGPTLVSHVAYMTLPTAPQWVCTGAGPETCYGWYLYEVASNTVVAAQLFDAPRVMDVGATEKLDPFKIGFKTLA
jgi:hypothetical protein